MRLSNRSLGISVSLILATLGILAGCTAAGAEGDEESAPTGTARSAQQVAYTCAGSYCTCTGDTDCNTMFSGTVCGTGPRSAVCQDNDQGVPRCRCTMASVTRAIGGKTIEPPPFVQPPRYFDPASLDAPFKR